jgi:probable DNA repair protein
LYNNYLEIQAFLEGGGRLVVPNRQRAAALRLAYHAVKLQQGQTVWESPDIWHWSAWVAQRQETCRQQLDRSLRSLSSTEHWFLWRRELQAMSEVAGFSSSEAMIAGMQRAAELAAAWGLKATDLSGSGGHWLNQLIQRLRHRQDKLGVMRTDEWRNAAPVTQPVWCFGLRDLGRADRQALAAQDVKVDSVNRHVSGTPRVVAAATDEAEHTLIADWCHQCLMRDSRARLLVVMPGAQARFDALRRELSERLDALRVLGSVDTPAPESMFAFEGGVPLNEWPLVAVIGDLLRLAESELPFAPFSALLRSPYMQLGGQEPVIALDLWLRQQQLTSFTAEALQRVAGQLQSGESGPQQLIVERLLIAVADLRHGALTDDAEGWARRWIQFLLACGWPGEPVLGSREHQVRQRFEEVLGEFAALGSLAGTLTLSAAVELFSASLRRTRFEPATGDVPVTVTGDIGDPLLHYDGIWVAGLTESDWPAARILDPYLSGTALQRAGLDAGTAVGALRRARECMQAWSESTDDLVYSWPMQRDGAVIGPSPMLGCSAEKVAADKSPWSIASIQLEEYGALAPKPWDVIEAQPGGAEVLVAQSQCAFRGFAEWRLGCATLQLPEPGIGDRRHGIIVHDALQRLWLSLGSSESLQQLGEGSTQMESLIARCVSDAIRQQLARALDTPHQRLIEIEQQRCESLLHALMRQERLRPGFSVTELEARHQLQDAGMTLSMRIDRLDRLEDGSYTLLDYKCGRPNGFKLADARVANPQLWIYATALGKPLAAVANVHLRPDGVVWKGGADRKDRISSLKPPSEKLISWDALLQAQKLRVRRLLQDFTGGEASVDPLPGICDRCGRQGLCRIDPHDVALNGGDGENDD